MSSDQNKQNGAPAIIDKNENVQEDLETSIEMEIPNKDQVESFQEDNKNVD